MTLTKWGAVWLNRRELDKLRSVRTDRGRWETHVDGSKLGAARKRHTGAAELLVGPLGLVTEGEA